MAKSDRQGKHLRDSGAKGHRRHRGRRVAIVCVVVALVVAAGVGYLGWRSGGWQLTGSDAQHQEATQEASQDQAATDGQATAEADGATTEAGDDTDAADGATADASSDEGATTDDADADSDGDAEAAEDEAPTRRPGEHDAPTADDLAAMDALKGELTVSGAGSGFADSDGYQELLYQVAAWRAAGRSLGFVLTDIGSGATVSYNADQVFYPASSIKGPFVCSLYEEVVENGGSESALDPVAENTIVNSDNDSFRSLHATYGESAFVTWLQAAGVPATSGQGYSYFAQYYYPHISAAQLDLMWAEIYRYCSSGTGPSQTLAGYFANRTTSPIADAVGDRYTSWGKAGWYYSSGDYGAQPATVDAGIVFADQGPYRLVMMSDAPGELDAMADLAAGMDAAAADLAA